MAPKNIKKIAVTTKLRLYEWNVMPFNFKNAIGIFSWPMTKIVRNLSNKFLKVFVDDVNFNNLNWRDHMQHI